MQYQCRLHNVPIFLSASIPTAQRRNEYEVNNVNKADFLRVEDAATRIEEAIICLARAIFSEGGTLVFGGHPSISPLVARILDHYYIPSPAEVTNREHGAPEENVDWKNPSLIIYQSRAWEEFLIAETKHLSRHPQVEIRWTDAVEDERVDLSIIDRPQVPRSMQHMRECMIVDTDPSAMVAIGGMQGVLDEAKIFHEHFPAKPIFALPTTGGAARVLAKRDQNSSVVSDIDQRAAKLIQEFWRQQIDDEINWEQLYPSATSYIPYAFVTQQIISRIIDDYKPEPTMQYPTMK